MLALNRYDGFGGMDLYVSFREDTSDIWTEPKNLGATINTAGDEAGPFLAYDGKSLYYASAGKGGFGGLDLFVARRLDDSWENWSEPENLGKDINSKFDEQNICLSALGDTAYIVATDTLNKRQAVYRACVPEALQPGPYAIIHGSVFLLNNNVPSYCYEQLSFTVNFDEDKLPETYYSNTETGEFYFIAPAGAVNSILIEKNRYNPNYASIDTKNLKRPEKIRRDIVLRPLQESDGILITKVNYAKDIDTLTSLSKQIISDFIAGIKHPNRRKYLIIGHADDSGSDLYNLKLSMRRANIASEFLESFGISKENIRIEWRGEIQPLSIDKNENRRVEIYVD
jgi:outer membrane protein OmpA-like peptidoglycan-associated protein